MGVFRIGHASQLSGFGTAPANAIEHIIKILYPLWYMDRLFVFSISRIDSICPVATFADLLWHYLNSSVQARGPKVHGLSKVTPRISRC